MCKVKKVLFLILVFMLVCTSAYADDGSSDSDKWQFAISPYGFLPGLDGDLTVAGQTVSADLSFSDILDNFDVVAFSNRVTARKGKLDIIFDISYISLETDVNLSTVIPPGSIGANVKVKYLNMDFGVAYRVVDTKISGKRLWIEPLGGLRYVYFEEKIGLDVDVTLPPPGGPKSKGATLGGDENWIEPFVGGRMGIALSEKFTFLLRYDASGFDIGDASKLTWNLVTGFDYRFSQRASAKFGYRFQGFDYMTGSGADNFGADVNFDGPMLGVTIYM